MIFKRTRVLIAALLLAACQGGGGLVGDERVGPAPPPGTPHVTEAVDGLIVGHRLMAAGEYELALKAYKRAALEHGLDADVLSAMGSANLRLGRLRQAETLLNQAVKKDETFVAAWNNLGVVLIEMGDAGQARRVFQTAFALDNGDSEEIRQNLRLAIARMEQPADIEPENNNFDLVRRGNGRYLLLSTPGQRIEQ
jgi:tetratricopeptide (TPR) repeat protein